LPSAPVAVLVGTLFVHGVPGHFVRTTVELTWFVGEEIAR
jgi:hypothetical protein